MLGEAYDMYGCGRGSSLHGCTSCGPHRSGSQQAAAHCAVPHLRDMETPLLSRFIANQDTAANHSFCRTPRHTPLPPIVVRHRRCNSSNTRGMRPLSLERNAQLEKPLIAHDPARRSILASPNRGETPTNARRPPNIHTNNVQHHACRYSRSALRSIIGLRSRVRARCAR